MKCLNPFQTFNVTAQKLALYEQECALSQG